MSIRTKINSFLVFKKSSSHPLDGPMQRWLHKKGSRTEFTPEELNGMTKQEKLAWIMARSNGSAKQWLDSPRPVQPPPQMITEPVDEQPLDDGFEGMDVVSALDLPSRGAPLRQVSPYDDPYGDLDGDLDDPEEYPEEDPDFQLSPDYRNIVTTAAPSNPNFPVVPAGMGFSGKRGVRIASLVRPPAEATEDPPAVPTIEWTPKKIASNALDKYHYSLLPPEAQAIARRVQQQLHVIPEDEWSSGQRLLHQKRDEYYQHRMRLLDSLDPEYIGQDFSTRTPTPQAVKSLAGRLEGFGHDPLLHHARVEHAIREKKLGLTRSHDDDFHGPSGAFAPDPYPHDPTDEIEF